MMKKSPAIIFGLILCLCLFACSVQRTSQSGINQKQPDMAADDVGSSDNGADTAENEAAFEKTNEEDAQRKLTLTTNGQKISITLYDTPAANALYDMLPLELTFEDFNGVEKISYLTEKLPTEGEPDGCDPDEGDLCLYAPWGNLSVFYRDYGYSESLIKLGHVDSGMDKSSGMSGDFSATLEKAK